VTGAPRPGGRLQERPQRVEPEVANSVTRANALDHVLVVIFENRSFDNILGRLYGPEDGKTFEASSAKT
jgi:phospholipase C